MTKPASFKQADLTRALKGTLDAGVQVAKIELEPGGKIVILAAGQPAAGPANAWDVVLDR